MSLVTDILDEIQRTGWEAALRYTEKFDHVVLTPEDAVWNPLLEPPLCPSEEEKAAIEFAIEQITRFHQATRPRDVQVEQAPGLTLEERFVPLTRVGLYVPNGDYPLLSSLLMTAIPARVAGVKDIVVAIAPRGDVRKSPLWIYTLQQLKISAVLSLGGAQAIGILGYGGQGFAPVDLIAGPGNRFVAEAKQELLRRQVVGIDLTAGPSEVLVIADDPSLAEIAAMDLLAQAEHAPDTRAFFVTWNPHLLSAVESVIGRLTPPKTLGHIECRLVAGPEEAAELANRIAPEHLGLLGETAETLLPAIRTAGAVFVGAMAGQALGDYVAGPSHVLPTGGTGRYLSGLSTRTFMRRISVIQAHTGLPNDYLRHGQALARLEGLEFHRRSLAVREGINHA